MQVAFGHARTTARAVTQRLGVAPVPTSGSTLLTVCNGNVQSTEVFDGKLTQPEIAKLLAAHKGGKKCRESAPPLPS
jgi:hypothetical protein